MSLFTVFSPEGERFEVTGLNKLDLINHCGWTLNPPETAIALVTAPVTPEPAPVVPQVPVEPPVEPVVVTPVVDPVPFDRDAAAARYAALDKDDVRAILKDQFSFEADGRWNLTKLIAKAVELEEAA